MISAFYRADPFFLCAVLTVLLIVTEEVGFRIKIWKARERNGIENTDIALMLGGVMTLLALMLGFTFTLSEGRFEMRRQLIVDEANAIGTTYLRTRTLPEPAGAEMRESLRKYVAVRLEIDKPPADTPEKLRELVDRSKQLQEALWAQASVLARENPNPVRGLLLQTLNQMIDISTMRLAAFKNRVPFSIYAVLFLVSVVAMWLFGAYFNMRSRRPGMLAIVLAILIASVMWLIMDLDQPLRGAIRPSQESLSDLHGDLSRSPD
ncbi:MAG: hypothetical protein ABSC19_02580 [Syntrophorhabdales bacterium]|jgi:hypothetical protein